MARPILQGDDVALGASGFMFIAGIGAGAVGAPQEAYLFLMILPLLVQAARFAPGGEIRHELMPPDRAQTRLVRDGPLLQSGPSYNRASMLRSRHAGSPLRTASETPPAPRPDQ